MYFNKASRLRLPAIYNRCGSKASKIPPPPGWWLSNCCHDDSPTPRAVAPAELRCVTLDQQEALPCPRVPQPNKAEVLWVGTHVTWQGRGRPHSGPESVPLTIWDFYKIPNCFIRALMFVENEMLSPTVGFIWQRKHKLCTSYQLLVELQIFKKAVDRQIQPERCWPWTL